MADDEDLSRIPRLGHYLGCPPEIIESALARQHNRADRGGRPRIGEVLVEMKVATADQVDAGVRAQRADRLRAIPLLSVLAPEDLDPFGSLFEDVFVEAGEQFITQDVADPSLYLLVSGRLEVFRLDDSGEEIHLRVVPAGEPVGEMGFFSEGVRSASVRALEPSVLLRARYTDMTRSFETTPRLAMAFWQVVNKRLHDLTFEYESDVKRRLTAERSLEHLHQFLDLSETEALGAGIEVLLENLVHAASSLMNADRASLFLVDKASGELWSLVAQGEEVREIRLPPGTGLVGWVAEHRELVNIPDAYHDPRFNDEVDRRTGYRTCSILCGPVSSPQSELLGVVQVINKRTGPFDAHDERLFRVFAQQAGVAVDNYLLYAKVLSSHEQMSVMLDIATSLNATLDLPTMTRQIVAKTSQALMCERSAFFVLDRDAGELWSMAAEGLDLKEVRFPVSVGIAGHCARTGETINIPDAYQDPRFNPEIDRKSGLRTRSVLCVPVRNRDGEVTGVTQAINKSTGRFQAEDEALLDAIASQIGVVLDNALLYARTVEMKNYLESVQDSISNSILTLDREGVVVTANKAACALFHDPDLGSSRRPVHALLGESNPYLRSIVDQVYEARANVVQYDVTLQHADGTAGTVNANVVPLTDGDGAFRGLVMVLEDVTREKRAKSTLTRYMSKDVVDRMLQDPLDQALGGIRGTATVLFSDIRRFTSIAETMTAEQTMDMLNEYFTLMVDEVMAEQGLLDKFMGDGLMAVFGVPYRQEDDAVRAVRCALGMHRALGEYNRGRQAEGLPPLSMGVGIHTDDVISGNMGSAKRMDYTVIGDGVNLASRIEGLNKGYETGILISENTLAALGERFSVRRIDDVAVKGRSRAIRVFEVLGDKDYEPTRAQQCYAEGMRCYEARRFREALEAFRRGAELDGPCAAYVARCEEYIRQPPPADWDGVWRATTK